MRHSIPILTGVLALALPGCKSSGSDAAPSEPSPATTATLAQNPQHVRSTGLFTVVVDPTKARVTFELPAPAADGLVMELLHVVGIASGVGSNDLGLDRGALRPARLLRLRTVGARLLVEAPNMDFRAVSTVPDERRAARESYATSVLWSTDAVTTLPTGELSVDVTEWVVGDRYGVARELTQAGEGHFTFDAARSALLPASVLVFPDNVELDALVTLTSDEPGRLVRSHVPDPTALTLVQHHSFVRLPATELATRDYDVRMGSMALEYMDHAVPLEAPLQRRVALRHRLERVDPLALDAPFRDPIVFYVDRGAPEPVRTALLEGAGWWKDAFEAARLRGAFKVELLPEGAHPLDVRYNVIQWVHRSTRGWSYGNPVHDPRTGEIIKGHVLLGSQRVRQDRLLFEGLVGADRTGTGASDDPVQLSLARLRQLAAHEVGHALGLAHNFSASTTGRASVMDYPAPRIRPREDGGLDVTDAYAVGVGAWDRYAVALLYGESAEGRKGREEREALLRSAYERGLRYHSDEDARAAGSALPIASLWDDGTDPVAGLGDTLRVRAIAIERFGKRCLAPDQALGELSRVFVPLYFHHRYMITAAAKVVGGVDYDHALAAEQGAALRMIDGARQRAALSALVATLAPSVLDIPEQVLRELAPLPPGYEPSREDLAGTAGATFDALGAAAALARLTLAELLEPTRLRRVVDHNRRDPALPGLDEVLRAIAANALLPGPDGEAQRLAVLRGIVRRAFIEEMMRTALDPRSAGPVRDTLEATLEGLVRTLEGVPTAAAVLRDVRRYLGRPTLPLAPTWVAPAAPPGPPIGARTGSGDASWLLAPVPGAFDNGHGHAPFDGWGACGCSSAPIGLDS
jgi:hypothetical protein